jgi:hypothetical protein
MSLASAGSEIRRSEARKPRTSQNDLLGRQGDAHAVADSQGVVLAHALHRDTESAGTILIEGQIVGSLGLVAELD